MEHSTGLDEYSLIEMIKNEKKIIIYGAGGRSELLMGRLASYDVNPHIFIAVSELRSEQRVNGIEVTAIDQLLYMAADTLVIVAARGKYHEEIRDGLKKRGFCRIEFITEELYSEMLAGARHEELKRELKPDLLRQELLHIQLKQELLQFQSNNRTKLESLKRKYQLTSKKIKVIFLIPSINKFGMSSVYWEFENRDRFEPFICIFDEYLNNHFSIEDSKLLSQVKKLEEEGYNVVWDYDVKKVIPILQKVKPDIVFYTAPYIDNYLLSFVSYNYLTCYIAYGMHLANSLEYHFRNVNTQKAWLIFWDSEYSFDKYLKYSDIYGINSVLGGYPKLDEYGKDKTRLRIPDKINNGRKVVIYAPHHSIKIDRAVTWSALYSSTFDLYYLHFLDWLKQYPEINFVFKPHPTLAERIKQMEDLGNAPILYEDYIKYCTVWNQCDNGIVMEDDSYIDLFQIADCLITDCGSFIGEWLPSEKPCIYLLNPNNPDIWNEYYDFAQDILRSYYLCNSWEEIKRTFDQVILKEKDTLKEVRLEQKEKFVYNLGNAGKYIAEYIEEQLKS